MKNKQLPSALDAALGQVDPERRRLLGVMLAGAAALPLLTTTALGQDDNKKDKTKPAAKNAWPSSKTTIKADSDVKTSGTMYKESNSQIKADTRVKTPDSMYKESNSQIKADTRVKTSSTVKSPSTQMKSTSAPIKSSNTSSQ
jgi:hypothetical protein